MFNAELLCGSQRVMGGWSSVPLSPPKPPTPRTWEADGGIFRLSAEATCWRFAY